MVEEKEREREEKEIPIKSHPYTTNNQQLINIITGKISGMKM